MHDPYDPTNLIIPLEQLATYLKPKKQRPPKVRRVFMFSGYYVPALPLPWIAKASRLPGKAVQAALVIWRQAALEESLSISLGNGPLEKFGIVDAGTKRRALKALEQAGLIKVEHPVGACPLVTILEVNDKEAENVPNDT